MGGDGVHMSVIKNLRNLSSMQFYKNAIKLRKELTNWMIRDFGTTKNKKHIAQVVKDIDIEDEKKIAEILEKYGKGTKFQSEYPQWFISHEREVMIRLLQELVENITRANSIYVSVGNITEYELRRAYQDKAIGCCYVIYQELQYITSAFGTDLNYLIPILESIEKEVDLLKGWRQSDNKLKGKI